MNSVGPENRNGFTLVEVLVAFVILALSATVIMNILSSGTRSADRTHDQREALIIARSTLDRVGAELPLATGETSGETDGGYRWRLSILPYQEPGQEHKPTARPFKVTVTVSWGSGGQERSVTLTTLNLDRGD